LIENLFLFGIDLGQISEESTLTPPKSGLNVDNKKGRWWGKKNSFIFLFFLVCCEELRTYPNPMAEAIA